MKKKKSQRFTVRWLLVLIDIIIFWIAGVFVALSSGKIGDYRVYLELLFIMAMIHSIRIIFKVYSVVWRYSGLTNYLRLILSDGISFILYRLVGYIVRFKFTFWTIGGTDALSIYGLCCLLVLASRLTYKYLYSCTGLDNKKGKFARFVLGIFGSLKREINTNSIRKINIAIVGAGRTGTSLAHELIENTESGYVIKCFIDNDKQKIGRSINDIPVFNEPEVKQETLAREDVDEIIFALPNVASDVKGYLFNKYKKMGYKIRVYDYPSMLTANANRKALRDFDIDELLFREQVNLEDSDVAEYYQDKTILITGGGGSIGSEMARQVAKMKPFMLILLDVYENGVYDVQQELKEAYGDTLKVKVEIMSVTNKVYLEKTFKQYPINIVIHAAAHKHVPLMERNCVEAVQNNVFGTYNVVDLAYKYKCERFIMVSTDKAVNPTNVMGATKRMCEMIVQAYSTLKDSKTKFSFTRFGNVLGSAGSVIPLFKRQIANGGPLTITDKKIIRYFMTIPEASALVLESGFLAKNGELFVLDMGKPIKILDLAENIISLSGYRPYVDIDIIETGLRPGEKLYEELLIKTETLSKTRNKLIFIEKDDPISYEDMEVKLEKLRKAVESNRNYKCRDTLKEVVPTFKAPEEVNAFALSAEEMKDAD